MGSADLCKAYTTYLRPVLEYGSIPIHSMLTKQQSNLLEKQQGRTLKIIFGFDKSTNQALLQSGLESLTVRRARAVDKFALKVAADPRYSEWFPLRPEAQRRSRHSNKYVEYHSNSSRRFNSPLYHMRRRLNTLAAADTARVDVSRLRDVAQTGRGGNSSQRCDFIYDEWR